MTRAGVPGAEPSLRPRALVAVEAGASTASRLSALLAGAPREARLVASDGLEALDAEHVPVRALDRVLGRSFDVVVLDLSRSIDLDALGRAEGLVRAGGALALVVGTHAPPDPALAAAPFTPSDVRGHGFARLRAALEEAGAFEAEVALAPSAGGGSAEQAALVEELAEVLAGDEPALVSIVAPRGRGKSAALGLAAARASGRRPLRIVATGAPASLLPFAAGAVLVRAPEHVADTPTPDVVLVDEAAQLPVPLLVSMLRALPRTIFALATTTRGYEGTGRGYVLRFLAWARSSGRPLRERALTTPIRYLAGDPVERFVERVCLFDAEPAVPAEGVERIELLTPERLAGDAGLLRSVFGLLVHAHYRTSPNDLVRLLDAPNLAVYALLRGDAVLAVSLVAREGGFSPDEAEVFARGERRMRSHALADTLVVHAQRPEAGTLAIVRSVRIATHPELRGQGLGRRLVEAIHAHEPAAELFGTVFGATPEIVRFRRALGYEVVRVGASRGARSGEPSVVMARPVSPRAEVLVRALREDLSRDLPPALELLAAEGAPVSPELAERLGEGLGPPAALAPEELLRRARRYVASAQPSSATPGVLAAFALRHEAELSALGARQEALLRARLLERRSWSEVATRAGLPSAAAATRSVRDAVAALVRRVER